MRLMVCITVSVCRRRRGLTLSHDPVIESLAFVASSIQCGEGVRCQTRRECRDRVRYQIGRDCDVRANCANRQTNTPHGTSHT